jgi:hypothetical protein
VDWSEWLTVLKQYGPIIGLFVGLFIWQTIQINRLLDRNSSIYDAEIKRLADVQTQLLTHILGAQPSSMASPTIKQLKDGASKPDEEGGQAK